MTSLRTTLLLTLASSAIGIATACGEGSGDYGVSPGGPAGGSGGGGGGGLNGADAGGDELPPEEELESSYGAPVATGTFVWIANPSSGRVAYIDAAKLTIEVVEAGNAPTFLAPIPAQGEDAAIVLNVLSLDATVLRSKNGSLSTKSLPVPAGGNSWAVSAGGRWAIAWTDSRTAAGADPIDGFQDISVLDLTPGAELSTPLTIGYRPVALAFDALASRAFAVTQDGISVISLEDGDPIVIKNVKLSDDPLDDTATRDVSITPDGDYALVRRDGQAVVSVFSLIDDTRTDVVLPAAATDLDLSPDGSVAVVVVRETGQVALLPIPGIVDVPQAFTIFSVDSAVVGSAALAPESPTAFLYTNAVPSPLLTVFDSSDIAPTPRTILLRAPVQAVFPTPDAAHALVLHDAFELEGGSKYPAAMSVVPVALDLPAKIRGLEAPVVSVAIAPAGHRALVATGDGSHSKFELHVAHLPSLKIDSYALASQPIAAGIVAGANRGFVAQKHPDGRITFVDFESGEVRTLTGFELATQVVNGSEQ
jgi:hypothetical protein